MEYLFAFLFFGGVGAFFVTMIRWAVRPEEKGEEVPSDMTTYMSIRSIGDRFDGD